MKFLLLSISLVLVIPFHGCKKHNEIVKPSQRIILTTDPYLLFMKSEADQYMSLYPKEKIEVKSSTTREAVVHLLNDSVNSIVIDRQFNEEENQVVKNASIHVVESKIAKDGIAVIVNKRNPIPSIKAESVKGIVLKRITGWEQISGARWSGSIDFVLTERNSGMYELLQNNICFVSKPLEPNAVLKTQQEVIQYVSEHQQAVGFVAASLVINGSKNIKVLPVIVKSKDGKEDQYLPGQQEIYESLYPFLYSLYLYNTEAKAPVGIGFSAFVLSNIGQTIIQKSSMVPITIPYRTIQLTAE